MVAIRIDRFGPAKHRPAPRLLANHEAQRAHNVYLQTGDLGAFHESLRTGTLAKPGEIRALHRFADQFWLHWSETVHAVNGPVPADTQERTYFTGTDLPRMTYAGPATSGSDARYPSVSYRMGVPAPATAPVATADGAAIDDNDVPEARFYVVTYVSALGEEGPPTNPSNQVDVQPGQSVILNGLEAAPSGPYNVVTIRIYRVGAAGVFQFVAEIPAGTSQYVDEKTGAELGEELPSSDWVMPPDDMHGLVSMPNGALAGVSKNEVCFSEPFLPHAWPVGYRLAMDYQAVGLGAFGSYLVAVTDGLPYIASGAHPSSMTFQKMETPRPSACVSPRGIVEMGRSVIYPSNEGLIRVSQGGVDHLTDATFTEAQWRALNPATIFACRYQDKYLAFHEDGAGWSAFLIDEGGQGVITLDLGLSDGQTPTGAWTDPADGNVYLAVDDSVDGNVVVRVDDDAGAALTYAWRSKVFESPRPISMSAAMVDADAYPVTLSVWADGEPVVTDDTVADGTSLRLPGGFTAKRWEVELSGTANVRSIHLATSVQELKAV